MALEGTHIRFAVDLKDTLKIQNLNEYISGSVYPDSRHTTGVEREKTHPKTLLDEDPLSLSDFESGWYTHLLCDRVQYQITMERFPIIAAMQEGEGNERWIRHTALKILQDVDDVKKFDIQNYLRCLDYVSNPLGEDLELLRFYNETFQIMYQNPDITIASADIMWSRSRASDTVAQKVMVQARKYELDEGVNASLAGLYDEMLKRAHVFLASANR